MIDKMKSTGYGEAIDKKAYYGFLKILCGIKRIDHDLSVFKRDAQGTSRICIIIVEEEGMPSRLLLKEVGYFLKMYNTS